MSSKLRQATTRKAENLHYERLHVAMCLELQPLIWKGVGSYWQHESCKHPIRHISMANL